MYWYTILHFIVFIEVSYKTSDMLRIRIRAQKTALKRACERPVLSNWGNERQGLVLCDDTAVEGAVEGVAMGQIDGP